MSSTEELKGESEIESAMEEEKKTKTIEEEKTGMEKEAETSETMRRPNLELLKEKVIAQIVRIKVSDGRIYVGRFECVDQDVNVFLNESSEIIDKECSYYYHYKIFDKKEREGRFHYKYIGSVVIPGAHIISIHIDHHLSKLYPYAPKTHDLNQVEQDVKLREIIQNLEQSQEENSSKLSEKANVVDQMKDMSISKNEEEIDSEKIKTEEDSKGSEEK